MSLHNLRMKDSAIEPKRTNEPTSTSSPSQNFWVTEKGSFISGDFKISSSGLVSTSPDKFYSAYAFPSAISKFTKRKYKAKRSPEPEKNSVSMKNRRLPSLRDLEDFSLGTPSLQSPDSHPKLDLASPPLQLTRLPTQDNSSLSVSSSPHPELSKTSRFSSICSPTRHRRRLSGEPPSEQIISTLRSQRKKELLSSDKGGSGGVKGFRWIPVEKKASSPSPFVFSRGSSPLSSPVSKVPESVSSSSDSSNLSFLPLSSPANKVPESKSSSSDNSSLSVLPLSDVSAPTPTIVLHLNPSPSSLHETPPQTPPINLSILTTTCLEPTRIVDSRITLCIPTSVELRSRVLCRNALKATRITEEKKTKEKIQYLTPGITRQKSNPASVVSHVRKISIEFVDGEGEQIASRSVSPEPLLLLAGGSSDSPPLRSRSSSSSLRNCPVSRSSSGLEIDCGPSPQPTPTTSRRTLHPSRSPALSPIPLPTPRVTTTDFAPSPAENYRLLGVEFGARKPTVHEPGSTTNSNPVDMEQFTVATETLFETENEIESIPLSEDDMVELASIGRGQNGKVVKALHLPSFNLVALKSVSVCSDGRRGQLLQELIAYSRLQSSSVASFVGAYFRAQDGVAVLASDYMNCGSLEKVVESHGKLSEKALRYLSRKLVEGFSVLQEHKLLHRDVKPQNILCNHKGTIQLGDFGLMTELEQGAEKSTYLGTRCYLSPERLHGRHYGFPSDIWAMGVTLLYCAHGGALGFFKLELWDMIESITKSPPHLTPSKEFSEELCSFINGCLHVDPALRSTIQELAEHPFLKTDENDLDEWKRILEPDLSDLDTVLEIISDDLSLDVNDLSKIRQSPGTRSYRRLRNTPFRMYPATPSPKEGPQFPGGSTDALPTRLDFSKATSNPRDSTITISSNNSSSQSSEPYPASSPGLSSGSDPDSRRSSMTSLTLGPTIPTFFQSGGSRVSTPTDQLSFSPSMEPGIAPIENGLEHLSLEISEYSQSNGSSSVPKGSPRSQNSSSGNNGAVSVQEISSDPTSETLSELGNHKSPAEIRVRLLLWVVHHLADQFGIRANEIVAHFESVLSRPQKRKRSDSAEDEEGD